ncbi:CAP domain-containing protein [Bacillus taeanensis]|uniref:Transporter n=1 Tax=Bacillus taeanensis TaxID=273032 RepID=A0A366XUN9_9BACI|nr:CAP domain-containing protein [Bacillus taeanensis]RBW69617.1 transporter [Bacillus taeanensis]
MYQPIFHYYPLDYYSYSTRYPFPFPYPTHYYSYLGIFEQEMINRINQERQRYGRNLLSIDTRLTQVARLKAKDMATLGNCEHYSPTFNGKEIKMLQDRNIPVGAGYGANVSCRRGSAMEVVNAWMASTRGHREVILNPRSNRIGGGVAVSRDGKLYWSAIFNS